MSDSNAPLIEAPKRRGPVIVAAIVVIAVIAGLVAFFATRGEDDEAKAGGDANAKVKLGVVGASEPYWETFVDVAAEEGIDIELIDFADYPQPNPALSEGEIDINQFQHVVYLAEYNVSAGEDLAAIGSTAIYPLGMYSDKYDSVEDIADGETVVVPDDDTNQARALLVLQSAGLISLADGGSIFSTLADVDEANSRVEVKAIKADLTPASLPDVAAAFINNDFVAKAGLEFSDAILQDDANDPSALPYVNIFAVRGEDKDDETLNKVVEIYQNSQEVLDGVQEASGGTAAFPKVPAADLAASLAKVQADTEANKG